MTLKEKLKSMAADQRELRNQMKTVRLEGKRTMKPWEAAMKHSLNRWHIRHLHIAYGQLRGKEYNEIENNCIVEPNWDLVDKYKEQYAPQFKTQET